MTEPFVEESVRTLKRTPAVLNALLGDLPDSLLRVTDGPGTWSPYDVIGHLIHGERTDWMTRLAIILEHGPDRAFDPFDREAQFRDYQQRAVNDLLDEFRNLRAANLQRLAELGLTGQQLELQGTHPTLGRVSLRQVLATWTAHDLAHTVQISRTMARSYRQHVGPFAEFLSVMK